jgi:proline iminopeptidase
VAHDYVAADGASLSTETSGSGDTVVVLCHGGPGLSDNLAPVASMIEDTAVVHRYDQRAGGRSTGAGPFTVAQFVEDLEGLRQHWGHESWIVGGHSWGGWLALLYTLRYPTCVSGIIAIGMPAPPSDGWRESYVRIRDSRMTEDERDFFYEIRRRRKAGEPVADEDERTWARLQWRTDFADPEAAPDFDLEPLFDFPANLEVNKAVNADMDAFAATHDLPTELKSITAPALFVNGEGDPRPAPHSVVAAIPDARLRLIDGAGHLPWLERPSEVAVALREFLGRVSWAQ